MDLHSVGAAIRIRRETLGLTQAKLAQMSGLSLQTFVGLEAGTLNIGRACGA
jgi:transcriptional regulator with XRE-family HTH domain